MPIKSLTEMFVHTLKDIHFAENKILKTLPGIIQKTQNPELADALTTHLAETVTQVERIKHVFAMLKENPTAEECPAINGILEEGRSLMAKVTEPSLKDIAIVASSQAVEHYEIVRYRSLVMWAGALGLEEIAKLMQLSLNEETAADAKLLAFGAHVQQEQIGSAA
jgi:ferritin-like metal-binding protein YciE